MKRVLVALFAACALVGAALPAAATTVTTDTYGSYAHVTVTTTPVGMLGAGHTFDLTDFLSFIDTTHGTYGQVFTYIPFSVKKKQYFTATMDDLFGTALGNGHTANVSPEWANIQLFQYSGDDPESCITGSSLCSAVPGTYAGGLSASIYAELVGGVNYLLRIGYGICGCAHADGGIQLTATVTPIPAALLMFLTALIGMGGVAWRRGGLRLTNRSGIA